jgi:hypothetical protein
MYFELVEQFVREQEEAGNFGGHVSSSVIDHVAMFAAWLDSGNPTELREDDDSCQCLMCGNVHRRSIIRAADLVICPVCKEPYTDLGICINCAGEVISPNR